MKSRLRTLLGILAGATLLAAPAMAQETVPSQLEDWEIIGALENQLELDAAVDMDDIDVRVTDGIAEITGRVDNLMAKKRATYIAEMVKGVRAVSNRVEVMPSPPRWDADVRRDVMLALLSDPATDSYEVDVAVQNGTVTLSGTVDSWAEKELSERVAMGVRGVVDLRNEIRIDYTADRPDTEIKPEVKKRLHWDVLVDDGLIDVAVDGGKVVLSGVVGSAAEKRKARADAWVAGVKAVDTGELQVRSWAKRDDLRKSKYVARSDAEIKEALKWAASYDPRVLSFHVMPEVHEGRVTLRGTVDNFMAKQAAEQLARHTVGVVGVTNRLKVRAPDKLAMRDDTEIASDIRHALRMDPYTESYEISVRVKDGIVTLTGSVDSFFERVQAKSRASAIRGVRGVFNQLNVIGADVYVDPEYYFPWYPPVIPMPNDQRTDEEVRRDIESQMRWSPFLDGDEIDVKVEGHAATLTGTVDTWREYHAATEQAHEGGAVTVINKLEVR